MSAPDTNIKKQEKDHKPMLRGGVIFGIVGVLLVLGFVVYMTIGGQVPVAGEVEPVVDETQSQQGD